MSVTILSQWDPFSVLPSHSLFVPKQKMRTNNSFLFNLGDLFLLLLQKEWKGNSETQKREARQTGMHLAKHHLSTAAVYVIVLKMSSVSSKENRHFSLLPAEIQLWGK